MKPTELDSLIDDCLEGRLSEADAAQLSDHLEQSPQARVRYWEMAAIHGLLENSLQAASLRVITGQAPALAPKSMHRLQWYPFTAAAGLLLGLFSASVVFAYGVPRPVAKASRLSALVDGSFEKQSELVASGFPSEFGKWSGDEAEFVSEKANDGKQALRFVRAEGDPALPDSPANSCDIYQLVDLRSLKADASGGETTLELSAHFLDARPERSDEITFTCRLYVFSGSPESLRGEWPLTRKDAMAYGAGLAQSSGGAPLKWRDVTTKVLLPAQADFAVVQLVAGKAPTGGNKVAEFGEQFADDVRLTLKTQPALPVRVAQP